MLAGERKRDDRVELVTVATPNVTHFEISKSFLEAGFHVLCEKPMTTTIEEGRALVEVAKRTEQVFAVNYGYSGYPLVRQMRAMVARGDLGKVRVVVAEFAGGLVVLLDVITQITLN
jgi:predicted dehydrogenase